jgi:hypothetical protein
MEDFAAVRVPYFSEKRSACSSNSERPTPDPSDRKRGYSGWKEMYVVRQAKHLRGKICTSGDCSCSV